MSRVFVKFLKRMFSIKHHHPAATFVVAFVSVFFVVLAILQSLAGSYTDLGGKGIAFVRSIVEEGHEKKDIRPQLNAALYDAKLYALAHRTFSATSTATTTRATTTYRWPVQAPYPLGGAILPFKRIVAFYGNLLSTQMGVLGEYPEDVMLRKLDEEVALWSVADPTTQVQPALHYIVVTAQGSPGKDGMYRARMPDSEVDKVIELAKKRDAIVFLDFQVGFSTIQRELPLYDKYLLLPEVHVGIDPEFSMKYGVRPGFAVGTYDASDINFVIDHLSKIVRDNNLPPKILIVHRYTEKMVTNYRNIRPTPEVQVVMHMDGWGGPENKKSTYRSFIASQPVQFTGFKLFYKNDRWNGFEMLTPHEILRLNPQPIYIQYQ